MLNGCSIIYFWDYVSGNILYSIYAAYNAVSFFLKFIKLNEIILIWCCWLQDYIPF